MTKKDLKNGMIVETRNGTRYLYCEGVLRGLNAWDLISTYTDDLKCQEFSRLDIVKVYEDTKEYNLNTIFEYQYLKLIWQRPEIPKLSEREIEILKALDVIGFTHIARDKGGNIFAYLPKPIKDSEVWFFHSDVHPDKMQIIKLKRDLFTFIKWKDKEPTNISNLLSKISNIHTYLTELEKNNETFKKWGDLYRIEENIINTIISTRKKKGLTQKEVAEMTVLKQSAIAGIENNVNSPRLNTLIKILYVLGLKIEIKELEK